MIVARKSISSVQLSKEIHVTQKTALFMMHRMREASNSSDTILNGIVEVHWVCQSIYHYVDGPFHVNSVESMWHCRNGEFIASDIKCSASIFTAIAMRSPSN